MEYLELSSHRFVNLTCEQFFINWFVVVHFCMLQIIECFICLLESDKTDIVPHHTITHWVIDEEFYNQQTDLLIPNGEYLKL